MLISFTGKTPSGETKAMDIDNRHVVSLLEVDESMTEVQVVTGALLRVEGNIDKVRSMFNVRMN